jgi:hypothetical protein
MGTAWQYLRPARDGQRDYAPQSHCCSLAETSAKSA